IRLLRLLSRTTRLSSMMGSSAKKTTLQRYLSQLQQHPLRTKIFADGFLGPVGHFFHTTMDKIFQGKKDTDCCKEG
ncbi:unnamed protein product, partial [Brassica oleracea var. botrytis]